MGRRADLLALDTADSRTGATDAEVLASETAGYFRLLFRDSLPKLPPVTVDVDAQRSASVRMS